MKEIYHWPTQFSWFTRAKPGTIFADKGDMRRSISACGTMYNPYAIRACSAIFSWTPSHVSRTLRKRQFPLRKHVKIACAHALAANKIAILAVLLMSFSCFSHFFSMVTSTFRKKWRPTSARENSILREDMFSKSMNIEKTTKNPVSWTIVS